MLLYADDLVLLAHSCSDLKTALEELERITREWGMVVNYPKTEAVVFACLPPQPPPPPRSKLDPTAWQSSLSSSMWAALCRQTGGRTKSSRGGCAQQGRSSDPSRQICSPPGGWDWAPSSSSTNPWCCRGSCTVQRSLGPSQRHRGHNWRPSTMAALGR